MNIGPGNPENGAFEDTCLYEMTNTSSAGPNSDHAQLATVLGRENRRFVNTEVAHSLMPWNAQT